jgi:hypothetical protein
VSFLWSIADLIRDTFKRRKYQDVILPLTVLRRLDCVLASGDISPSRGEYFTTDMAKHPALFDRHTTPALEAALADTPVVLVVGLRQVGKTTLCRLVADRRGARLLSLDDAATLAAAGADPAGSLLPSTARSFSTRSRSPHPASGHQARRGPAREPGRFLLSC